MSTYIAAVAVLLVTLHVTGNVIKSPSAFVNNVIILGVSYCIVFSKLMALFSCV
jgi:hypothetical protein